MVCLMCLVPLFLVPIVNILPLLVDFLLGKVYKLFGWNYRKPERAAPACPYKPATGKINDSAAGGPNPVELDPVQKPTKVDDSKLE